MTNRDSDDILKGYVARLGNKFGAEVTHALWQWCDLWMTWKTFRNLFCDSPERFNLLNECGGAFFARVDRVFFDSVLLSLCRLTDHPKSLGKRNLTLMGLVGYMDTAARRSRMSDLLDQARASTTFARQWRDRKISHNDYDTLLSVTTPLDPISLALINAAIKATHEVLAYIHSEFLDTTLAGDIIDPLNNELVMLDRLYLGDIAHRNEMAGTEAGHYQQDSRPSWLHGASTVS